MISSSRQLKDKVKFIDEDVSDEVVKADLLGLIWTNRNAFYPNGQLEFIN